MQTATDKNRGFYAQTRSGIAAAGTLLADTIKMIDVYPEKGMLATITKISTAVGGLVANTLIDLAKIDGSLPLFACGRVGSDVNGDYLITELEKHGIDVHGVKRCGANTSFSDVMTVNSTGERTFFHARGANAEFNENDIDIPELSCRIFHLGYLMLLDALDAPDGTYGTKAARLIKNVRDTGIEVSLDVVSESSGRFAQTVLPALKYCDYLIINEVEAGLICEIPPRDNVGALDVKAIEKIMRRLLDKGVNKKCIIHAPEAGFCMDKRYNFTCVSSLELPEDYIIGSVGAGDAFCAGCLYSIHSGWDDTKMLEFAAAAAACNLSASDSVSGMRSKEEIFSLQNLYKKRKDICL